VQYFWEWALKPLLRFNNTSRILEIGASFGGNTVKLLRDLPQARIAVIDPCFDDDLVARYRNEPRVEVHKGRSLEVLPNLSGQYDAILIDGDHNYYTVYNELKLIAKRALLARTASSCYTIWGRRTGARTCFTSATPCRLKQRRPDGRKVCEPPSRRSSGKLLNPIGCLFGGRSTAWDVWCASGITSHLSSSLHFCGTASGGRIGCSGDSEYCHTFHAGPHRGRCFGAKRGARVVLPASKCFCDRLAWPGPWSAARR
jgi:hypothetical protein